MNGASIDVASVAIPMAASTSTTCRTIDCVAWPGVGPAACSDIAPRIQLSSSGVSYLGIVSKLTARLSSGFTANVPARVALDPIRLQL